MNKQEIFDKVIQHLYDQGVPAVGERGCAYRTEEGLKCAVGCLIPDDIYDPNMDEEALTAGQLLKYYPSLPSFMRENSSLLTDLQNLHDHYFRSYCNHPLEYFKDDFLLKAHDIASTYELNSSIIKETFDQ